MEASEIPPTTPEGELRSMGFLSNHSSNWGVGFGWSKHEMPHIGTHYARNHVNFYNHVIIYNHSPRSDTIHQR